MNRIFKYALMFAFVGIAIFALSQMSGEAAADTHVWDGGGSDELASTAANWVGDSAPVHNDAVQFDGTSSKNCTWSILGDSALAGWNMESTYSGTVTITGIVRLYNTGGFHFHGGNLIQNSRTLSVYGFIMSSTGTWTQGDNIEATWAVGGDGFTQSNGVFVGNGDPILLAEKFIITAGINTGSYLNMSGTANFNPNGNTLGQLIISGSGTITQTGAFKVGIGGIIQYSGTFTKGAYDVTLYSPANLIMTSDFGIDYCYLNASCGGGGSFSVDDILTIKGSFVQRIYYNGTADISTDQQHWTGWLYTENDIAIEYNSYAYLEFNHDAWLGVQLESWSGTDNFTWNATSVASQTVVWSWSRGESTAMYDEYMDTIYIGSDETNAGGMGTFTSTFVGSHAFLLSRSTFLPASTDIDDSVWLGILFMCIATIINFVGYVRKIGLLQIVSFLVLLVGIFAATDVWEELWTLPTLFVLTNAVIFIIGMMRKG